MLGARHAFIVRPYAYASALTLALASVLALALATIALALTEPGLAGLAGSLVRRTRFRWREVPAWTLGLAIIGSAAFGGLVGAFASRRHMRRNLAS